ncbi:MAG: PQQ-binding-like beta-propeller repeat protein [Bacteroidales bacterium]|nr:PQQ-binding-like beta-propeller repeat protein [Bacteroidales bacterium]MCF8390040.1 PQQ-binding-like beta-propeller repeat protein [Bacteroidales bacterium]
MDQEAKIKLSHQIMIISGIFSLFVASLLLFNFWHMYKNDPVESKALKAMVEQLSSDPGNEELITEIRNYDLLARKAYFTSVWQVNTGSYLLLFGGLIFALALRINTDLRKKITKPEGSNEKLFPARIKAHRWLLVSGGVIIALSLWAGFGSKNYLKSYSPQEIAALPDEGIEVVQIVEESSPNAIDPETIPETNEAQNEELTEQPESPANPDARVNKIHFGFEDFRKNHNTFRGPFGQGISFHKNIPTNWDATSGKNIRWKVATSKPGYNSPVIWNDKIFISGADKTTRMVSCFNRNNGQLIWEHEVKDIPGSPATPPKTTDDTGLAAPTMAVDGYFVYAIFGTGDIIAFDLDGKRIWARNIGVPVNHYGHSSSLMVWKNKLIVQYDTGKGGRMLALNTETGEAVWDIKRDNLISWSSPVLADVKGKIQIITSADPNVAGYDIETGKELWKIACMMGEVAPSPGYYNGMVYATNEYAILAAIDPSVPSILWENDEYLAEVSSPVAANGILIVATSYGVLVAYDAMTGDKYWEHEFSNGFYSSPMIADGKVYIIDMGGITHIISADKTGKIIGQPELGEDGFALPAFAEGRIYLRTNTSLYCIEEE